VASGRCVSSVVESRGFVCALTTPFVTAVSTSLVWSFRERVVFVAGAA